MPKTHKTPFFHMEFPNFLNEKQYTRLLQVYQKLQFKQKSSDLFHFFQTNQLANQKNLNFFKDRLSKQFSKLCTEEQFKKSFYTTFASYYFEGDYLLCHDDIVEDRKYAFSYYLEDFEHGGELVLFNDKANKECKRFKPRKNTLVIFQVCDESYHQVAYCTGSGRKAVTGWFNVKNQGNKRVEKKIQGFLPNLLKESIPFALDQTYIQEEYFQLMDVQYQFNITKQTEQGPFYSRRVNRIQIQPAVVFELPGYTLLSSDFYKFKQGDYLLLNDPVNTLQQSQDIVDIFVTHLPEGFQVDEENMLVKIIEEDGSMSGIPEINDSLFVVHRRKKQFYVERNQKEFVLAHFIYRKESGNNGKKNGKESKVNKEVKKVPKKEIKKTTNKKVEVKRNSKKVNEKLKKQSKTANKKVETKKLQQKSKTSKKISKATNKVQKSKKNPKK